MWRRGEERSRSDSECWNVKRTSYKELIEFPLLSDWLAGWLNDWLKLCIVLIEATLGSLSYLGFLGVEINKNLCQRIAIRFSERVWGEGREGVLACLQSCKVLVQNWHFAAVNICCVLRREHCAGGGRWAGDNIVPQLTAPITSHLIITINPHSKFT